MVFMREILVLDAEAQIASDVVVPLLCCLTALQRGL